MSPLIDDSSSIASLDLTESSEMSSAKTNEFLDFAETKSNLNSWRITIHLLIFPLITGRFNTY
jgi:hypothetical protein